jgi:hypothetical protein
MLSWEKYRQQRNFTTALIRSNKTKYYSKLNERLQGTSISSWGIIKSLYGAM